MYICRVIGFSAKYKDCLIKKLKIIKFKKNIFCYLSFQTLIFDIRSRTRSRFLNFLN